MPGPEPRQSSGAVHPRCGGVGSRPRPADPTRSWTFEPENPYWLGQSVTFEDPDGWRVVLCQTPGI
ncbi:hypothetical protein [Microvirga pakistanensis]|uniref:hypothetical protein n=1 Tax=Microvirga pakistanensis TaxID=1682650 RepID=UPI003CC7F723